MVPLPTSFARGEDESSSARIILSVAKRWGGGPPSDSSVVEGPWRKLQPLCPRPICAAMGYETDLKLFIDGVWKSADAGHSVVKPVDAQPIADVPYATQADLDEALAASERAWPEWRSTDVEKRGAILHKTAALLRERVDLIARTMTQEQGKPLGEAKLEVLGSAQLFDWYAEDAKRDYGRTLVRPAGQLSRVIRQPVGPVATFTPWNFPIYLLAKKVSAALAAGCTVISRPPHETPGCCTELFRALADAGIPAGVAQLVHGDSASWVITVLATSTVCSRSQITR